MVYKTKTSPLPEKNTKATEKHSSLLLEERYECYFMTEDV